MLLTDEGTDDAVVAGLEEGIARRGATPVLARIPFRPCRAPSPRATWRP